MDGDQPRRPGEYGPPIPAADEGERARAVRDMFASIAPRYDLLNHLLSANADRRWRRACVESVLRYRKEIDLRILDVGCGTGDLSLAFSGHGTVVGCDFCHPMLVAGNRKVRAAGSSQRVFLSEGDALALPFPDATFDIVVSAFVVRNLANMERGFGEMRRILRAGGIMAMLDFGLPTLPLLARVYRYYFTRILPALGRLVSGVHGPYTYLPRSVHSFPPPQDMQRRIAAAGFRDVEWKALTGGIALLFVARVNG